MVLPPHTPSHHVLLPNPRWRARGLSRSAGVPQPGKRSSPHVLSPGTRSSTRSSRRVHAPAASVPPSPCRRPPCPHLRPHLHDGKIQMTMKSKWGRGDPDDSEIPVPFSASARSKRWILHAPTRSSSRAAGPTRARMLGQGLLSLMLLAISSCDGQGLGHEAIAGEAVAQDALRRIFESSVLPRFALIIMVNENAEKID